MLDEENIKSVFDFSAAFAELMTEYCKSTAYDVVKTYVIKKIGKFSKREVLSVCPSLGSSSVEAALKKLVEDGTLVRVGAGRNTLYARVDSKNDY